MHTHTHMHMHGQCNFFWGLWRSIVYPFVSSLCEIISFLPSSSRKKNTLRKQNDSSFVTPPPEVCVFLFFCLIWKNCPPFVSLGLVVSYLPIQFFCRGLNFRIVVGGLLLLLLLVVYKALGNLSALIDWGSECPALAFCIFTSKKKKEHTLTSSIFFGNLSLAMFYKQFYIWNHCHQIFINTSHLGSLNF